MKALLGVPEIAERLNMSTRNVHRIIRLDPSFPAHKPGGFGHWKADPEELEKWIRKKTDFQTDNRVTKPRRGRPPLSGTSPRR